MNQTFGARGLAGARLRHDLCFHCAQSAGCLAATHESHANVGGHAAGEISRPDSKMMICSSVHESFDECIVSLHFITAVAGKTLGHEVIFRQISPVTFDLRSKTTVLALSGIVMSGSLLPSGGRPGQPDDRARPPRRGPNSTSRWAGWRSAREASIHR